MDLAFSGEIWRGARPPRDPAHNRTAKDIRQLRSGMMARLFTAKDRSLRTVPQDEPATATCVVPAG